MKPLGSGWWRVPAPGALVHLSQRPQVEDGLVAFVCGELWQGRSQMWQRGNRRMVLNGGR